LISGVFESLHSCLIPLIVTGDTRTNLSFERFIKQKFNWTGLYIQTIKNISKTTITFKNEHKT